MPSEQVRPRLDIAMPVHNEGASIEKTLLEWYGELKHQIDIRFLIAEDGSKDDTKSVLRKLEGQLPMHLDT
jgi:glycosyltransferase involved in cell wall biosynthesis